MAIVREKEILKDLSVDGMSTVERESTIRMVVEKSGIDFGRTCYCRGVHPTREWTNDSKDFEPSLEEQREALKRQAKAEEEATARAKAESDKDALIAQLTAQNEALKRASGNPPPANPPGKPAGK